MSEELKGCPFCGGSDIEIEDQAYHSQLMRNDPSMGDCRITCNDCMARSDVFTHEDGDRVQCAIAAWNTRNLPQNKLEVEIAVEYISKTVKMLYELDELESVDRPAKALHNLVQAMIIIRKALGIQEEPNHPAPS